MKLGAVNTCWPSWAGIRKTDSCPRSGLSLVLYWMNFFFSGMTLKLAIQKLKVKKEVE